MFTELDFRAGVCQQWIFVPLSGVSTNLKFQQFWFAYHEEQTRSKVFHQHHTYIRYIYVLISGQGHGTLGIFAPLSGMEVFSNLTMKSRCDQRGLINVTHIAQNEKKVGIVIQF